MYVSYALLLAFLVHNVVRFVVMQKRYRFFHIAYFYILVTFIVIMRVAWFSLVLADTRDSDARSEGKLTDKEMIRIFYIDCFASYAELLIGI